MLIRMPMRVRHLLRLRPLAPLIAMLLNGCASHQSVTSTASETVYHHGAVAADHPLASLAGLEMLRKGGNAVDAAVATSFCLSVVRPFSCGLGGGGFMLIAGPGIEPVALDYRETCPASVGPDFYLQVDDPTASRFGCKASGVPGSVAGLCFALKEFGSLDLKTVLQPAIRAAEDGFPADAAFVAATASIANVLENRPDLERSMGVIWTDLCRGGHVQVGDVLRNPEQAKALRLIADDGPQAFYDGAIAHAIIECMRESGGTLTAADLAGYRVRELTPLHGSFREYEILSMPPPSSGGIAILQTLGILEQFWREELVFLIPNSPAYVHGTTEAMKNAFADRARWLCDPEFADVPVDELLSEANLRARAAAIDPDRTKPAATYGVKLLPEDSGTSHLCIIDGAGMAVSCTETINLEFGSLVCVPGFGFCLNDEMDDFTTRPGDSNAFGLTQSEANRPHPGQRPLSSMSPTIVLRDGKVALIAGGSGGPRIISATTQCLLNAMMFGMTPGQAVSAPRFHHQWMPDTLLFDKYWTDEMVIEEMRRRGHQTGTLTNEAAVQMIAIDASGQIRAASDPRKGGKPAGW